MHVASKASFVTPGMFIFIKNINCRSDNNGGMEGHVFRDPSFPNKAQIMVAEEELEEVQFIFA